MYEHLVHALADLGELVVLHEVCCRALVRGRPALTAVVAAEDAGGRDTDVDALGVGRIKLDRMQTRTAKAGLPAVPRRVLEQSAIHFPRSAAVVGEEEDVWIAAGPERLRLRPMPGLDVPHPLQRILVLRHGELLGALPRAAEVVRA